MKVDVIVTYSTPAVIAVKQVTSVIPVVFAGAADPVRTGLVVSLARPGGNITGLSVQSNVAHRARDVPDVLPKTIRLSSYLANALRKSQHQRADGDGCVGPYLN